MVTALLMFHSYPAIIQRRGCPPPQKIYGSVPFLYAQAHLVSFWIIVFTSHAKEGDERKDCMPGLQFTESQDGFGCQCRC